MNADQIAALLRTILASSSAAIVTWLVAKGVATTDATLIAAAIPAVASVAWTVVANSISRAQLLNTAPPGTVIVPAPAPSATPDLKVVK